MVMTKSQEALHTSTYESIRETLLGSSRRVLKDGVSDVLILDLAKRDTP